jgi:hypothetical protein
MGVLARALGDRMSTANAGVLTGVTDTGVAAIQLSKQGINNAGAVVATTHRSLKRSQQITDGVTTVLSGSGNAIKAGTTPAAIMKQHAAIVQGEQEIKFLGRCKQMMTQQIALIKARSEVAQTAIAMNEAAATAGNNLTQKAVAAGMNMTVEMQQTQALLQYGY